MIGSWVVKLVIAIALVAFAAFEIGSPVITHVQLDDGLHEAADSAALTFFQSHSADAAKSAAQQIAQDKGFTVIGFNVDDQGTAHLTGEKKAHGIFFDHWKPTKKYYDVTETVTGHYNQS